MRPGIRIAGAIVVLALSGAAHAVELVPYRALYSMTLDRAERDSGVAAIRGEMAVDWTESCAGWSFAHQSLMDVLFAARDSLQLANNVTTWESADGLEYRFNLRNLTNGRESEHIAGTARLFRAGGPGQVVFTAPEVRKMALPAGTIFPVRHSVDLIAAAGETATFVTRTVFDGMSFEGAFDVSAAMGPPKVGKRGGGEGTEALAGRRYWPIHIAFYPVGSPAAAPAHEIAMDFYDNGISDNLFIDFGDFTVRARLARLELGQPPACG